MRAAMVDDPLCCCEYVNSKGERSHLLALFCDCAEVDDMVDRLVKGLPVPNSRNEEIMATIEDRLRIPWKGGARRVPLDVVLPWILVPLNLWLSSISLTSLLVVHGAIMPFTVYLTYRICLRSKMRPKTKFFASWSIATTAYLFCIYQYQVVGLKSLPKIISPLENVCLIIFLFGAFYSAWMVRTRAIDGLLSSSHYHLQNTPEDKSSKHAVKSVFATRYCRTCDSTVEGKEHHCVWLDACVSLDNFYPFISFLFCIFVTLIHSGLLFLTSVCDSVRQFSLWSSGRFVVLVPTNCWGPPFNQRFEGDPGLVFAAGIHCLCLSLPILAMLVHKVYLASSAINHFNLSWKTFYRKRLLY